MTTSNEAKFDPAIYERMPYDNLTVYVIFSLVGKGVETTFENIVAEAFSLFPARFSLRGYPQWPDSATVNKSWLRCRTDKHYIEGSVKEGFRLTPMGLKVVEEVERQLLGRVRRSSSRTELYAETKTKAGRLLRAFEKSKAFTSYLENGHVDELKDHDLTDMLLCMPDSDKKVIEHNLEQFRQAAELYKRKEIVDLLALVQDRLLKGR